MNENQMNAIVKVTWLIAEAQEILENLAGDIPDEKIGNAIDSAHEYLWDISGNMWAIIDNRPEDIEEL